MTDMPEAGMKRAASHIGIPFAEYKRQRDGGQKWCTGCKAWHPRGEFHRSVSNVDGLNPNCAVAQLRNTSHPRQRERRKARSCVCAAVTTGRIPSPRLVPCADCGHLGEDRKHEYDHFAGYAPENWLSVEAVCRPCHIARRHREFMDKKILSPP